MKHFSLELVVKKHFELFMAAKCFEIILLSIKITLFLYIFFVMFCPFMPSPQSSVELLIPLTHFHSYADLFKKMPSQHLLLLSVVKSEAAWSINLVTKGLDKLSQMINKPVLKHLKTILSLCL